ncbi:hypothetical protein U1Q18_052454 [Sarracenia purpurea var. burkii]
MKNARNFKYERCTLHILTSIPRNPSTFSSSTSYLNKLINPTSIKPSWFEKSEFQTPKIAAIDLKRKDFVLGLTHMQGSMENHKIFPSNLKTTQLNLKNLPLCTQNVTGQPQKL